MSTTSDDFNWRVITALEFTVAIAGFLAAALFYVKLKDAEATIARQNVHLEQVAKDLTKEKAGVEATLAECNAALAATQIKVLPAIAPALPLPPIPPSCPVIPTCPLIPPPVVCPPVTTPAQIATPVPARIHRHLYLHRRHHFNRPAPPDECTP